MKKIALIIGSMIAGGIISAGRFYLGCKGGTACRKNVDRRT
ncbi:Uncharacterised protein [Escherichia coli]|uniref:Uncharacterized protein n=1 Tax=Escherichia coli TaxID=562 RepID=A0A2X1NGM6_ECOLX|nr:Uncharacterised protein [Escherichia coli]